MNIPVGDFILVILIFLRIISAFTSAPVYGDQAVPVLARVFLSLVIAYIIFLTIDKSNLVIETNLAG